MVPIVPGFAADQPAAVQVRDMAIVQIAVHGALNAIEPRCETCRFTNASTVASPAAAVAAATHGPLVQLLPAAALMIEQACDTKLASIGAGPARMAGIARRGVRRARRVPSLTGR